MLRVKGATDTGKTRPNNEDSFNYGYLCDDSVWAIVCDGMGGANAGHIASKTTVDLVTESIQSNYKPQMDDNSIRNLILTAINKANSLVFDMAAKDQALSGMGTTVVVCIVRNGMLHIAHAGDSRAYILGDVANRQITEDHTVVQYLLNHGEITSEQAENHPQKHYITRAVGVEAELDIDYNELSVSEHDIILICTDGLSNHINDFEMSQIVTRENFEHCADELIEKANASGGTDNITVVVIAE